MIKIDTITLFIFLGFWPIWLVWELTLLWMRGKTEYSLPGTISMVAKNSGWRLNSVVYLWGGLAAHYWWPGPYATVVGSVAFWVISLGLFIWDLILWGSSVAEWSISLKWVRWPLGWLVIGVLAGRFLFPQVGITPWHI